MTNRGKSDSRLLKPLDREILQAVATRWNRSVLAKDDRWPHEIIGQPERLVERRMERMIDRGYLEAGVSTRSAWLTDKGRAVLAADHGEPT